MGLGKKKLWIDFLFSSHLTFYAFAFVWILSAD